MRDDTIIFDFDGTIADSLAMTIEIFRGLTGWQGGQTPEELKRLSKLSVRKLTKELKVPLYQIPSLLVRGRKIMMHRITDVEVFPGISEVIKTLHTEGRHMLVMSSNSDHNVEVFLRHHKLYKYFDGVYGGVGLLNKAAAMRKVMRIHGLNPNRCVYIGDEQRDIEGAHRAHIRVISVSWGYNDPDMLRAHRPTAIAAKPEDILEIVSK